MMNSMPLFVGHGISDGTVPLPFAMISYLMIIGAYVGKGLVTTHIEFNQTHELTDGEMGTLNDFIADALSE